MFRKLVLALAVGSLLTGSAWAQVYPANATGIVSPGIVSPRDPQSSLAGLGNPKTVNPANSQKGIIAVLIGLAKQPGTPTPPAAKSAVPRHPTLKDQMKGRFKSQIRNQLKNGKK